LSRLLRQIGQDDARLAECAVAMNQHRHFTHLVDVRAILRAALLALDEEVDEDRRPVGADEIEHQGGAVGVPRLRETIKLIFGHEVSA
jgi:hypothetical protein